MRYQPVPTREGDGLPPSSSSPCARAVCEPSKVKRRAAVLVVVLAILLAVRVFSIAETTRHTNEIEEFNGEDSALWGGNDDMKDEVDLAQKPKRRKHRSRGPNKDDDLEFQEVHRPVVETRNDEKKQSEESSGLIEEPEPEPEPEPDNDDSDLGRSEDAWGSGSKGAESLKFTISELEGDDNATDSQDDQVYDQNGAREDIKCVPKQCVRPKGFKMSPKGLKDPQGFTLLASFPGAGSTWTRAVIEEATRLYTGSVYGTDLQLLAEGFKGEKLDPYAGASPKVSVIKTHHPLFHIPVHKKTKYAIQVLRSPYDALLSEFNREFGGGHVAVASQATLAKRFPSWFKARSFGFYGHMKFWNGPRFYNCTSCANRANGVTTFELMRPASHSKHNFDNDALMNDPIVPKIPVLVVFYEDLYYSFGETVQRILKFLKERSLGDAMPDVNIALQCAEIFMARVRSVKRSAKSKALNPYRDPNGPIAKSGYITRFCDLLAGYWVEEKWGKCEDAYLQPERFPPRKKVRPAAVISKELCADDPNTTGATSP